MSLLNYLNIVQCMHIVTLSLCIYVPGLLTVNIIILQECADAYNVLRKNCDIAHARHVLYAHSKFCIQYCTREVFIDDCLQLGIVIIMCRLSRLGYSVVPTANAPPAVVRVRNA